MRSVLKVSIAAMYFMIAGLIIAYPNSAQNYLSNQYKNLRDIVGTLTNSNPLPEDLISRLPLCALYLFAIFIHLGGFFIIFNWPMFFLIYSYFAFLLAVLFSMPKNENLIRLCRRLCMIFAMFFASVVLFIEMDDENAKNEKRKGEEQIKKDAEVRNASPRSKTKKEK